MAGGAAVLGGAAVAAYALSGEDDKAPTNDATETLNPDEEEAFLAEGEEGASEEVSDADASAESVNPEALATTPPTINANVAPPVQVNFQQVMQAIGERMRNAVIRYAAAPVPPPAAIPAILTPSPSAQAARPPAAPQNNDRALATPPPSPPPAAAPMPPPIAAPTPSPSVQAVPPPAPPQNDDQEPPAVAMLEDGWMPLTEEMSSRIPQGNPTVATPCPPNDSALQQQVAQLTADQQQMLGLQALYGPMLLESRNDPSALCRLGSEINHLGNVRTRVAEIIARTQTLQACVNAKVMQPSTMLASIDQTVAGETLSQAQWLATQNQLNASLQNLRPFTLQLQTLATTTCP